MPTSLTNATDDTCPLTETPFSLVGPKLYDMGYNPIPIMPGDKKPGMMVGDEWRLFKGWNEFCVTRPSRVQIEQWTRWPLAGVGVACGLGLICIDIDIEEAVEPLLAILPPSPVQKKGRKGISLFYRGNTEIIRSKNFRTPERVGLVDLLAEGKQTVIPPSIHPDTNEPYYWWTDETLADYRLEELPELPGDIAEKIAEVLRQFGYDPEGERFERVIAGSAAPDEDNIWRRINNAALADLHAWVPKLGLPKCQCKFGSVYRAVAPWRASGSGRPLMRRNPNLSLSTKGIEDFGTGEKFTAIDVVMKALSLVEGEALEWLAPLVGVDLDDSVAVTLAERVVVAAKERESQQMETDDAGNGGDDDDFEPASLPPKSDVTLADLTKPPGLVGEIVDWIEASAEFPSRELALGAAIGFVATITGRGFETPSRARTNLYMIALAPSGYGKDHAVSCINTLAMKAEVDRFIGPAKFMSASGLRDVLMRNPSVLCIQDEFGGILRQIDGPNVGVHSAALRTDMLGYFSRAKDFYAGAAYATIKEVKIFNPNLSILGLSTPSDFWSAVTSARGSDGFLPRFLLFNIDTPKPKRVKPAASGGQPPPRLIERVQALYCAVYGTGNLAGALATGERPFSAKVVSFTDDANAALDDFERQIEIATEQGDEKRAPFLNRAREHAVKLALTVAVGVDPTKPMIDWKIMDWAIKLSWLATCSMVQEAETKIADNERQRIFNLIYDHVRKAGPEGIQPCRLLASLGGAIRKAEREEITNELCATGRIRLQKTKPPGGGRPSERYVAREFVHANDNNRAGGKAVKGGS
jgi:hypothetical protein